MSVSIRGTTSNVQINNAHLHVTGANKEVQAPKAVLSGADDNISLTASSNVGLANTSPIHTLDVGTKVFIDESADDVTNPTLRVRGLLKADTINFNTSASEGAVFIASSAGALTTDAGLSFNAATNILTATGGVSTSGTLDVTGLSTFGELDVNAPANIEGTLTLSNAGTGLSVTADATVGGTLDVTGALSSGAATLASASITGGATVGGTLSVTGLSTFGELDVDAPADIEGTLTLSNAGTGLSVTADATVGGTLDVTGALSSGAATLASASITGGATVGGTLSVTGLSTFGELDVDAPADIEGTLTLSNAGTGLSVTADATVGGTLGVTGALSSGAATLASASITGGATVGGTLSVTGLSTFGELDVDAPADIEGTLTLSNAGTGLSVTADATVGGTLGVTGALSSGAATLASASITGGATVGGTLGVTGNTTLDGTLDVNDNFKVNTDKFVVTASSGNTTIAGTVDVTDDFKVNTDKFVVTASSGNTSIAGTVDVTDDFKVNTDKFVVNASTGNTTVKGSLQVEDNLIVNGDLTVIDTTNVSMNDPIILLGNTHTQGGITQDVGLIFRHPTSNVATFFDDHTDKYRICYTSNSANDTSITPSATEINMEVTGNLTATNTITANSINLGGSNIRIEGNSIVFG